MNTIIILSFFLGASTLRDAMDRSDGGFLTQNLTISDLRVLCADGPVDRTRQQMLFAYRDETYWVGTDGEERVWVHDAALEHVCRKTRADVTARAGDLYCEAKEHMAPGALRCTFFMRDCTPVKAHAWHWWIVAGAVVVVILARRRKAIVVGVLCGVPLALIASATIATWRAREARWNASVPVSGATYGLRAAKYNRCTTTMVRASFPTNDKTLSMEHAFKGVFDGRIPSDVPFELRVDAQCSDQGIMSWERGLRRALDEALAEWAQRSPLGTIARAVYSECPVHATCGEVLCP